MNFAIDVFWPTFSSIVTIIIYLAIVILYIKSKNLNEKIYLSFIVIVYFFALDLVIGNFSNYLFFPSWDVYSIQVFMVALFSLIWGKLLIGKKTVILLTAIFLISMQLQSFLGIFIAHLCYCILSLNFVIFTIKEIIAFFKKGFNKIKD